MQLEIFKHYKDGGQKGELDELALTNQAAIKLSNASVKKFTINTPEKDAFRK